MKTKRLGIIRVSARPKVRGATADGTCACCQAVKPWASEPIRMQLQSVEPEHLGRGSFRSVGKLTRRILLDFGDPADRLGDLSHENVAPKMASRMQLRLS